MHPNSPCRRSLMLMLVTLGMALPASFPALAQEPPPATRPRQGSAQERERPAPPQVGQMLQSIREAAEATALSADQKEKVEALISSTEVDLAEILPRLQDMRPERRRQELQAVISGLVEAIDGVLTPEQKPGFREGIATFREDMQRRGAGRGPATGPASRPATRPAGQAGARAGQYLERVAGALQQLDLTPEQDEKVNALLSSLRQDVRQLAQQHRDDPQALARAVGERLETFRPDLAAILTPPQRERLANLMEAGPGRPATRPTTRRGGRGNGGGNEEPMADRMQPDGMQAMDGMAGRPGRADPAAEVDRDAFLDRLTTSQGLAAGQVLPESVSVVSLSGKEQPLRQLVPNMQALVVIVGSASSPTFRDRMTDLEWLRKETMREADLLIIYTREQHAAGEWTVDRNKQDDVEIPQHEDLAARIAAAKALRTGSDLKVQVVVDTMDDAALKALVGDAPHCAALVFAPGGRLVGKQQWFDPTGIQALVEEANKRDPSAGAN